MRKLLYIVLLGVLCASNVAIAQDQSVGINVSPDNLNANAVLELVSPSGNQGILVPRLDSLQIANMLTNLGPADNGLMVFETTRNIFRYYSSSEGSFKDGLGVLSQTSAGGDLIGTYPNPSIREGAVTEPKIGNAAVTNPKLAENAVSTSKIQDANVTTEKIANGAVTSDKLAVSGVTAGEYGNDFSVVQITVSDKGLITGVEVAQISIDSSNIENLSILGEDIANNTIPISKIDAEGNTEKVLAIDETGSVVWIDQDVFSNSLAGDGLTENNAVIDLDISDVARTNTQVNDSDLVPIYDSTNDTTATITRQNLIESAPINNINVDGGSVDATIIGAENAAAASVTDLNASGTVNLGDDQIQSNEIEDGQVQNSDIGADAVTSDKINDETITVSDIGTDAVGSSEVIDNSLTADDIGTDAVDGDEIATDAVGSDEIATDAVGQLEIRTGAVTSDEIADETIATADVSDNAISATKLNPDVAGVALEQNATSGALDVKTANGIIVNTNNELEADLAGISGDGIRENAGQLELDINGIATDVTTIADNDLIPVYDASSNQIGKITRSNLIQSAPINNIDVDGGAIDGTIIGANSQAAGSFTDVNSTNTSTTNLTASGAVDLGTNAIQAGEIQNDEVNRDKINADVAGIGLLQGGDGSLEINEGNGLKYNDTDGDILEVDLSALAGDALQIKSGETLLSVIPDDQTLIVENDSIKVRPMGIGTEQIAGFAVVNSRIANNTIQPRKLLGPPVNTPTDQRKGIIVANQNFYDADPDPFVDDGRFTPEWFQPGPDQVLVTDPSTGAISAEPRANFALSSLSANAIYLGPVPGGGTPLQVVLSGDMQIASPTGVVTIQNNAVQGDDIDATDNPLAISGSQVISLTTSRNAGNDIQLNASSGEIDLTAAGLVDLNSNSFIIDATTTGAISTGANLTLTSGDDANITGANDVNITGTAANVTINAGTDASITGTQNTSIAATNGALNLDAANGAVSIDAGAASNFTTSSGTLTLDGSDGVNVNGNANEIDITTSGAVDINGGATTINGSTLNIEGIDNTNITMTASDAADKSVTIASSNSGTGEADVNISADNDINLNAGGAVNISGTIGLDNLTVANQTDLNGNTNIGNEATDVIDVTGITNINGGNLTITSPQTDITSATTNLTGALDVDGATTTDGITNTGDISTSNDLSVGNNANVTGNTDIDGTLGFDDGAVTTVDNIRIDIRDDGNENNTSLVTEKAVRDAISDEDLTNGQGTSVGGDGTSVNVGGGNAFDASRAINVDVNTLTVQTDAAETGSFEISDGTDITTIQPSATSLAGTLSTAGNTTVGGDLGVTGEVNSTGITNTGDISTSNDLSVGNNAAVTGNLDVDGATTTDGITNEGDISTTNDLSVGNNAAITGNLDVDGATTTDGITNTGDISTSNDLSVGNNANVTGNTDIDGTLGFDDGAVTTVDNIRIDIRDDGNENNTSLVTEKAVRDAISDEDLTNGQGTSVGGDGTSVNVGGGNAFDASRAINVDVNTLTVQTDAAETGSFEISDGTDITTIQPSATSLAGTLSTAGNTTVGGDLGVTGEVNSTGITNTGDISTSNDLSVGNNAAVTGNLDVDGATTTDGITNEGDISTSNDLSVGNNAAVTGNLDVDGATTTDGITNTGDISTSNDLSVGNNANVTGNTDIDGTLGFDDGAVTTVDNIRIDIRDDGNENNTSLVTEKAVRDAISDEDLTNGQGTSVGGDGTSVNVGGGNAFDASRAINVDVNTLTVQTDAAETGSFEISDGTDITTIQPSATSLAGTLSTAGNTTVGGDLGVTGEVNSTGITNTGDISTSNDLSVGNNANVTGNTDIDGTLSFDDGAVTTVDNIRIDIRDDGNENNTSLVTEKAVRDAISDEDLTNGQGTSVGGDGTSVNVGGGNAFDASRAINVDVNTLTVQTDAAETGSFEISDGTDITTIQPSATSLAGTLSTAGNTTVGGDLGVTGEVNSTGITNTGDISTSNDLSVGNNAAVTGNLDVDGATTTDGITNEGDISTTNDLSVGNNAAITGNLDVDGATTTDGITNTGDISTSNDLSVGNNANVTGNTDIDGTLGFDDGAVTTVDNIRIDIRDDGNENNTSLVTEKAVRDAISDEDLTNGQGTSVGGDGTSVNVGGGNAFDASRAINVDVNTLTVQTDAAETGSFEISDGTDITTIQPSATSLAGTLSTAGNTTVGGDLGVTGEVNSTGITNTGDISTSNDLSVGNNAAVTGNLDVDGATTTDGITNEGDISTTNDLSVGNNANVTGNTDIDGTLGFDDGAVTTVDNIRIDIRDDGNENNTSLVTEKAVRDAISDEDLTAGEGTSVGSDGTSVNIGGGTIFTGSRVINVAGNDLTVETDAGETGSLAVSNGTDISTIQPTSTSLAGTLSTVGNTTVGGDLGVTGEVNSTGITNTGDISTSTDLSVGNNAAITGNLDVDGSTTTDGITNTGDISTSNDLSVGNNAAITGNLDVDGATTTDGITNEGDISTTNDLSVGNNANVTGNTDIDGTLGFDDGAVTTVDNIRIDIRDDGNENNTSLVTEKAVRDAISDEDLTNGQGTSVGGDGTSVNVGGGNAFDASRAINVDVNTLTVQTDAAETGSFEISDGTDITTIQPSATSLAGTLSTAGNTTVGGDLGVTGEVNSTGITNTGDIGTSNDLSVGNNTAVTGNLDVDGATTTDGITNEGDISTTNDLSVGNNANVMGNTDIDGTLGFDDGAVTTVDNIRIDIRDDGNENNTSLVTEKAVRDAISDEDLTAGEGTSVGSDGTSVNIGGGTIFTGSRAINVAGNDLTVETDAGETGSLAVSNGTDISTIQPTSTSLAGTLSTVGNTTVGGDLGVTGEVNSTGITNTGDISTSDDLVVGNDADITGNLDIAGSLSFDAVGGVNRISTNLTTNNLSTDLVSANAVKTYVDNNLNAFDLQSAYDNGNSILTIGTSPLQVSGPGKISLSTSNSGGDALFLNASSGTVDIHGDDAVRLTAAGASIFSVEGFNLTLATVTNGDIELNSANDITLTADDVDINGQVNSSGLSVSGGTSLNQTQILTNGGDFNVSGSNRAMISSSAGTADAIMINASSGAVDIEGTSGVNIDATAASHLTVTGAQLDLGTTTSGDVVVTAADDIELNGTNVRINGAFNPSSLTVSGTSILNTTNINTSAGNLTVTGTGNVLLQNDGGLSISNTLGVTGTTSSNGISNTGNISTSGNVSVGGNLTFDGGATNVNNISTDLNASAQATDLVTALEVKDYVDTEVSNSTTGTANYVAIYNASGVLNEEAQLSPTRGGTGVDNGANTITVGGNLSTDGAFTQSGSFATTVTSTAPTSVTLPTTGTLATLAGTETLTNKTLTDADANTQSAGDNSTKVATTAYVDGAVSTSNTLNSANIYVGNASNVATGVSLTGDASIDNAGELTVNTVGGSTAANIASGEAIANTATDANTASAVVRRDASGNFSAGTITANLTGDVTGDVTGTATNVTGIVAGATGGTGVDNGANTITVGGNLSTDGAFTQSGSFATTLTSTAPTSVTLPTTGTLATLAGTETLTNKTLTDADANTQSAGDNSTKVATTAYVDGAVSTSNTLNSANIYVGNASNVATGVSLTGDASIDNAGELTVNTVGGSTAANIASGEAIANTATDANTASAVVRRDASGNFSAGTITANLTGDVTGDVTGTATNVTGIVAGATGGTGVDNGANTITVGGNLSTDGAFTQSGSFATTVTSTAPTSVTLPTTGTLATLAGTETLTNKTLTDADANTQSAGDNSTKVATTAYVDGAVSTSNTLNSANIYVGNASNVATGVSLTGDASIDNAGELTVNTVGGSTAANIASGEAIANTATDANTASAVVRRDASGNFSAGTITANLTGDVTGDVTGTATNVTGIVAGATGGTGVDNGANTITVGGNLSTDGAFTQSGSFATTLTSTAPTSVTLPTTGTLATLAGTETLTNKTLTDADANTQSAGDNSTKVATTAYVDGAVSTSNTLNSANIYVGNASNVATGVSLTGDASIDNAGELTVNTVGGSTAANIASGEAIANTATDANTASAVVRRDASGNFSAGTITANLTGDVTGDVTGTATNVTGIVAGATGGTGVDNGANTITVGGNLSTDGAFTQSGSFATTVTSTAPTSVTLPTTGTLATLAGTETLTNKSVDADLNTVTNIDNAGIKGAAAIDVSKLADGTVSNAEFQRINGLLSAAVGEDDTQVLTNKTLTSPNINTAVIEGGSVGSTTPVTIANVDNLRLDGNILSSTNANGDIIVDPNGTGGINLNTDATSSGVVVSKDVASNTGTSLNVTGGISAASNSFNVNSAGTTQISVLNKTTIAITDTDMGSGGNFEITNGVSDGQMLIIILVNSANTLGNQPATTLSDGTLGNGTAVYLDGDWQPNGANIGSTLTLIWNSAINAGNGGWVELNRSIN